MQWTRGQSSALLLALAVQGVRQQPHLWVLPLHSSRSWRMWLPNPGLQSKKVPSASPPVNPHLAGPALLRRKLYAGRQACQVCPLGCEGAICSIFI